MVLIQNCAKLLGIRPPPEDLLKALNRFANECENGNYESTVDFDSQESDRCQIFRDSVPNIHKLLHEESHFRHLDVGDWTLEEEDHGISIQAFSSVLQGMIDSALLTKYTSYFR